MKKCILCGILTVIRDAYKVCKKCHKNLLKKDSIRCNNCYKGRVGRCRQCINFVSYCVYCGGDYCNIVYCCQCI